MTFLAPGTQQNPIPLGESADTPGNFRVSVLSVTPNATQQVLAVTFGNGNRNAPPPPGKQDFMVLVSVTYTGGGKGFFSLGDLFPFAPNGTQAPADAYGDCGFLPEPNFNNGLGEDIFSGGTIHGNVCFQLPSNYAASLILGVGLDGGGAPLVFFALR